MKNKLKIGGLLFAMCFTFLTGCGKEKTEDNKPEAETTTDNKPEASATEDNKTEAEATDYNSVYENIIKKYQDAIANYAQETIVDDELGGVIEYTMNVGKENALDEIGYSICDISGDEIPELIIGIIEDKGDKTGSQILSVYTCVDGKAQYVFGGWGRNSYFLKSDNVIYNSGSGGAASAVYGLDKLSQDGTKLECKQYYFTEAKNENYDIGFYKNTSGSFDVAASEEITEKEFLDETDKLGADLVKIEYTPLSTVK